MAKLTVTTSQKTLVNALDALLEEALAEGVQDGALVEVVQPLSHYTDLDSATIRPSVRDSYRSVFAAYVSACAGLTTTVPLAKLTGGGSNGSLTFTNGILTAKSDPT